MSPEDQKKYPSLTFLLKHVIPKLKNNSHARAQMKTLTKMTDEQFDNLVTWGKGPLITMTSKSKATAWGQQPSTSPEIADGNVTKYGQIYLNGIGEQANSQANNLEESMSTLMQTPLSKSNVKKAMEDLFIMSILVMHEGAHWAFDQYYETNGGDPSMASDDHDVNDKGFDFTYLMFGTEFRLPVQVSEMGSIDKGSMSNYLWKNIGQPHMQGFGITKPAEIKDLAKAFQALGNAIKSIFKKSDRPVGQKDPCRHRF
jgi:hypothetical protein